MSLCLDISQLVIWKCVSLFVVFAKSSIRKSVFATQITKPDSILIYIDFIFNSIWFNSDSFLVYISFIRFACIWKKVSLW